MFPTPSTVSSKFDHENLVKHHESVSTPTFGLDLSTPLMADSQSESRQSLSQSLFNDQAPLSAFGASSIPLSSIPLHISPQSQSSTTLVDKMAQPRRSSTTIALPLLSLLPVLIPSRIVDGLTLGCPPLMSSRHVA